MRVLVVHRKCPSILLRLCCSVDVNSFIIYSRRGIVDPNRPPVPAVRPRPYLVQFLPNYVLGALFTASSLLNSYTNYYPDWTKNTEL